MATLKEVEQIQDVDIEHLEACESCCRNMGQDWILEEYAGNPCAMMTALWEAFADSDCSEQEAHDYVLEELNMWIRNS